METNFAIIEGMFKINSDIVKKAIADILPEQWFRRPGGERQRNALHRRRMR